MRLAVKYRDCLKALNQSVENLFASGYLLNIVSPILPKYVQGVEVATDYNAPVPKRFDVIELPAAKYLMFKSAPFAEENCGATIEDVRAAIKEYDPKTKGYLWDESNPRIQLEPIGSRGYIELLPIKKID